MALVAFLIAIAALVTALFTDQHSWSFILTGLAFLIGGTILINRRKGK